jgi:hypothetical protein
MKTPISVMRANARITFFITYSPHSIGLETVGKGFGISASVSPYLGLTNNITLQESPSKSNKKLVTKKTASYLIEAVSEFDDEIIFFAVARAGCVRSSSARAPGGGDDENHAGLRHVSAAREVCSQSLGGIRA